MGTYSFVSGQESRQPIGRMRSIREELAMSSRQPRVPTTGQMQASPVRESTPPKSTMLINQGARFIAQIEGQLVSLGARKPNKEHGWAPWVLETKAGKLYILVYSNRVLCTFENATRAAAILGAPGGKNRLTETGRWDFVFADGAGLVQVDIFISALAPVRRGTEPGVSSPAVHAAKTSAPVVVPPPSVK